MREGFLKRASAMRPIHRMLSVCVLALVLSACSHTYQEDRLVHDLKELCLREYGIEEVQVKIVGKTIGVHLPLQKLFSADLSGLLGANADVQKVQNLESLMQFSPEAMEKVENVLFSTSRVILSTDKDIDFYVLTATDTESTGIQLVLAGYVNDLKRVRFWDISRDEYRKRIANDLRMNRGVIWKKPVEDLFREMGTLSTDKLLEKYFTKDQSAEEVSPLFYSELLELSFKKNVRHDILEVKSTSMKEGEVAIYVKVRSTFQPLMEYVNYDFLIPSGYEAEYIFILAHDGDAYKIERVVPFHFVDESEKMERVEFPEELGLYRNMDNWLEDFAVEEIHMPDFLAEQLTRRVQQLMLDDPEVINNFDSARVEFSHMADQTAAHASAAQTATHAPGHFRLLTLLSPKKGMPSGEHEGRELFAQKKVQYILDKALREFVDVVRSYRFEDFDYLDIVSPVDHEVVVLGKQDLQLYRERKVPLVDLLHTSYPL